MAWQDLLIPMIRGILGDFEPNVSYSDDRLESLLIIAAKYVNQEMDFDNEYTIIVEPPSLSPDPTSSTTQEDAFVNFMVLRAVCIIDMSNLRIKAGISGLEARAGPAILKSNQFQGYADVVKLGNCALYNKLKWEYQFGNKPVCRAVLSSFVSNSFSPDSLGGGKIGREEAMFF